MLALFAFIATAALPGAQTSPPTSLTLANGLRVVLERDTSFPSISAHVLYGVGSVDDPPTQPGLAHLVEHLAFVKTKHVKRLTIMEDVSFRGATHVNGETHPEMTEFFETVPASEIEGVLWLESERMGFLAEGIDQDALDNHRAIIARETEHRAAFGVNLEVWLERWRSLFPAGHPYANYLNEKLGSVTVDDARRFADRYYGPRNAVLVLVGDLPENAMALVHRYFDDVQARGEMPTHEMALTPKSRFEHQWKNEHTLFVRAWAVPGLAAQSERVTIAASMLLLYSAMSVSDDALAGRASLGDVPSDFTCRVQSESFVGNGYISLNCVTTIPATAADMSRWLDLVVQRAAAATRPDDLDAASRAMTVALLSERQTFAQRAREHARDTYLSRGTADDPRMPVDRDLLLKAVARLTADARVP